MEGERLKVFEVVGGSERVTYKTNRSEVERELCTGQRRRQMAFIQLKAL